jgi:hypothetical protein
MNYDNLNEIIEIDFLRLILNAVCNADENGYENVTTEDFAAVKAYAETNFYPHELAIQMGLAIQQCRNGLNYKCERLAVAILKQLPM